MPAADFLQVVDSITPHVNPNEVNIIITGGEPLMRDDLEEVGMALYRKGYPWGNCVQWVVFDPRTAR